MHAALNHLRVRAGAALLGLTLLGAACRDSGASSTVAQATPPPPTGQAERNVSLASGGNVALAGEATASVRARSGNGSVVLRITRIGTPGQTVGGAPWLQQVGNLIQLEAEGGAMPPSVDLQLRLVKDRLPQGIDEDHIFAARVQHGMIQPQPTRVNLRGLTATVAVSEPGTFAVFAVQREGLAAAIRDLWGTPSTLESAGADGCPVPQGALVGGCRRAAPDGDPRRAVAEVVNPRSFHLEVAYARGSGVSAGPRDATPCGNGVVVPPRGRVQFLVAPLQDDTREGSVAFSAAPSACAQFVQVATVLLGPVVRLDPARLTSIAAAWYEQAAGNRLLRAADKAWQAGDRPAWAADVATYLMNPDRLEPLLEALGQASVPVNEQMLREQAFAAGDVIDAVASVRAMLSAPIPSADGTGGPALLEMSFTFPAPATQGPQTSTPAVPEPPTPAPPPAPVTAAPGPAAPAITSPAPAAPASTEPPPEAATATATATPAPPPSLPLPEAGTGRIVVLVQREGLSFAVRVSLAPSEQGTVLVPPDSTTATFEGLRPGAYTVAIPEFGCRRTVTVEDGATVVLRMTLAANPATGGFRCTVASG